MEIVIEARKLANFINDLDSFETIQSKGELCYQHAGALFVDITLQAGLNYNSVVRPRVQRVLNNFPESDTVGKFSQLVEQYGLEYIIDWKSHIKIDRIKRLIRFALDNKIDTCNDFKNFLEKKQNQQEFLNLSGVGPKTLDYTLKLLDFDTVAVDRHIYGFVKKANIAATNYMYTKKVVEYAADFLSISRSSMDYSIWIYMSKKGGVKAAPDSQIKLQF